jgi:hypothetical protein
MCVLSPIESCSRARSSGVGWARITHKNATVTTNNIINVPRTRITDSRLCGPGLHRRPSALGSAPWRSGPPVQHARLFRLAVCSRAFRSGRTALVPSRYLPVSHCHHERTHGWRPANCEPHIATLDRVGTSTEHMRRLLFRQARCRLLAPETSKPRSRQCLRGFLKGYEAPSPCAVTDYPEIGKGAPYSRPANRLKKLHA